MATGNMHKNLKFGHAVFELGSLREQTNTNQTRSTRTDIVVTILRNPTGFVQLLN